MEQTPSNSPLPPFPFSSKTYVIFQKKLITYRKKKENRLKKKKNGTNQSFPFAL